MFQKTLSGDKTVTAATNTNEPDLKKKISLVTDGISKFYESVLMNRTKFSQENASVVTDYIIAMRREINPRPNYMNYTIQFLSELSLNGYTIPMYLTPRKEMNYHLMKTSLNVLWVSGN